MCSTKNRSVFRRELALYFTAQMFYSRLPVPASMVSHDPLLLSEATRYFPLVGALVALLSIVTGWMVYLLTSHAGVAALLALLFSVWLTGAFHEDGLADACDGFGGGWQAQQILEIMKDSRLGTYGAVGLWGGLSLRWILLWQLMEQGVLLFAGGAMAAFVLSRWAAVCTIKTGVYARMDGTGKVKPVAKGLSATGFYLASAITFMLAIAGMGHMALPAAALVYLTQLWMYRYFKSKIGGYTGDCLGAIQQISECVTLLFFLASLRCL